MTRHAVHPTGRAYLDLVTDLLQRYRLANPITGLWEAADLQWWYCRDPHLHKGDAVVWVDGVRFPRFFGGWVIWRRLARVER